MTQGSSNSTFFAAIGFMVCLGCTLGEGNPSPASSKDASPPTCPAETPKYCGTAGEYEGGCWPAESDCSTLTQSEDGTWWLCDTGQTASTSTQGSQRCCPKDSTLFCDETSAFAAACYSDTLDCDTRANCGESVALCPTDQLVVCLDEQYGCCPASAPTWCPPTETNASFCAGPNADCQQTAHCANGRVTCNQNETSHCTSTGDGLCCDESLPAWCAPYSAGNPDFPGACMPADTSCATISSSENGWTACKTSDVVGRTATGGPVCCGGETPVWCNPSPNTDPDPSTECFPASINCDTLFWDADQASWQYCDIDAAAYGTTASNTLICCDDANPVLCPIGSGLEKNFDGAICLPADTNCDSLLFNTENNQWDWCSVAAPAFGAADDGSLTCCGSANPLLCDKGTGTLGSFDGSLCVPADTPCGSLTPKTTPGQWDWCDPGTAEYGLDLDFQLICCDQPANSVWCGTETDGKDSAQCFPAGTNCKSLTPNPDGKGWQQCIGDGPYGVNDEGILTCCGTDQQWCPAGNVLNGYTAYVASALMFKDAEQADCSDACTVDSDCAANFNVPQAPGGVWTIYGECIQPMWSPTACARCVFAFPTGFTAPANPLNPLNDFVKDDFPGMCISTAHQCNNIQYCGQSFVECEQVEFSCYCWDGQMYGIGY